MTESERKFVDSLAELRVNVSATMLGAVGGGPPLKYLWIPFAGFAVVAAVVFAW